MRLFISIAAGLIFGLCTTARTASADIIFDLSNVELTTGTLTGSFTTNNALSSLVAINVTASASGGYPGETYTLANSTLTASLPIFFQLDMTGASGELRLIFSGNLQASGAPLTTSSYEFESAGGVRTVTSGSVVATSAAPEPTSAALIAAALLPFGWYRMRRYLTR